MFSIPLPVDTKHISFYRCNSSPTACLTISDTTKISCALYLNTVVIRIALYFIPYKPTFSSQNEQLLQTKTIGYIFYISYDTSHRSVNLARDQQTYILLKKTIINWLLLKLPIIEYIHLLQDCDIWTLPWIENQHSHKLSIQQQNIYERSL